LPKIPTYQRRITPRPVGKKPLPVSAADVGAGAIGAGYERLGASLSRLGSQLLQIKTAEDVAQGVAEYNNLINEYTLSLKDKSPEEYLEQNVAGQLVLPRELLGEIDKIQRDKTGPAARNLQNKFKVSLVQ